jgi:hypothetical protein
MRVIDETLRDIDLLMTADFGVQRSGDVHQDFVDWLHYRARAVPMLRRRVLVSTIVQRKQAQFPAIGAIRAALEAGADIRPWLSDKIRNRKRDHRADMMFNDWQILHFHLSQVYRSTSSMRRSGPLLFAHVRAEEATLLDVQPHGSWTRTQLLEILLQTNAPALERYEQRGITPQKLTNEQYANLRSNHTNVAIDVCGRAFMPGMGLLGSGHAARLFFYRDFFFQTVTKFRHDLEANQIEPNLRRALFTVLGAPVRLGAHYDHHGLAIIDHNRPGLVLCQMKPLE